MCGIAGFINHHQIQDPSAIISNMMDEIIHRGPDSQGSLVESQLTFGHRRLSINDLSESGAQPMASNSGRYLIVFNGEIYNFLKLKKTLATTGISNFRGGSDTEVLLKYLDQYGIEETLKNINGMFAFAIWDKEENCIILSRDRIGQKPLYYYSHEGHFAFSSELKSLIQYPFQKREIDKTAVQLYFKYNTIPSPYSIFKNVKKLPPGTFAKLDLQSMTLKIEKYWDVTQIAHQGLNQLETNYENAIENLENILLEVIEEQTITDVPYGAFLSGGIDSSLIVSLMQSLSANPIDTFTIGFNEKGFNEAVHAKEVAKHLGTSHHELYLSEQDFLEVVPNLTSIYSEPFSDSSQIPTFLVSKMARKSVTVCLSGDGGDELFAGYNRHFWIDRIWKLRKRITPMGSLLVNKLVQLTPTDMTNQLGHFISNGKWRSLGDQIGKASKALSQASPDELYNSLVAHHHIESDLVLEKEIVEDPLHIKNIGLDQSSNRFLLQDQLTYLPNDILTKVDRAAMANSLETRIPFLDRRVVEYSWKIPLSMKCTTKRGKLPLRSILDKYVPRELIERPKAGFGIPLDTWLRNGLKDWSAELLKKDSIINSGLLDYDIISKMWDEHQSGRENWQYHLWDIIMFQSWFHQFNK